MTKSGEPLQLIRNAIQTPDGTILESTHRHDYREYLDADGVTYMVDGGLEYVRRSGVDQEDMCLYDNEPHEVQRVVLKWGTYGKDGGEEYHRKAIADMTTAHIALVLTECNPSEVHKNCMVRELEDRE